MSIFGFFDRSGKFHDQQGFICLCGYPGSEKDWDLFHKQWITLLRQHDLEFLHLTQFESECRKRGWSDDKKAEVLNEFIDLV